MFLVWETFYVVKAIEKCHDMKAKVEQAIEDITPELKEFLSLKEELEGLYTNVTAVSIHVLIINKMEECGNSSDHHIYLHETLLKIP